MVILTISVSCAKPPESDAPIDGAFASFAAPIDHGEIVFGTTTTATLTPDNEVHTWTFTVTGTVAIHAATDLVPQHSGVDTVMYLYEKSAAGWGSYLVRNDDDGRLEWSSIDAVLAPGDYRLVVKGYSAAEHGGFELTVDCSGAGCTSSIDCFFGTSAAAIDPTMQLGVATTTLTPALALDDLTTQRVILALHESIHTEVTALGDAFAAVDDNAIQSIALYDRTGARGFAAIEYAAGGNTYGAIFAGETADRVAAIHDDTLVSCTTVAQTCRFGDSFAALIRDLSLALVSQQTVTKVTQLDDGAADEAVAALRVGYPATTDLASGLALVGAGGLDVRRLEDSASRKDFDIYDYQVAGARSGAIFLDGTLAATIAADALYDCAVLR